MADGVDARVQAMQATGSQTPIDSAATQPHRQQLATSNDAVLHRSQGANLPIPTTSP